MFRPIRSSLNTSNNALKTIRHNSTSTTSTSTSTPNLSWPSYLGHKKVQRRYNLFFSIPTTATGFILGAGLVRGFYDSVVELELTVD